MKLSRSRPPTCRSLKNDFNVLHDLCDAPFEKSSITSCVSPSSPSECDVPRITTAGSDVRAHFIVCAPAFVESFLRLFGLSETTDFTYAVPFGRHRECHNGRRVNRDFLLLLGVREERTALALPFSIPASPQVPRCVIAEALMPLFD